MQWVNVQRVVKVEKISTAGDPDCSEKHYLIFEVLVQKIANKKSSFRVEINTSFC